jgi:hypothetical protein
MDTLLTDIVPLIRSIDDAVDAWENTGFKLEHTEGIKK